MNNIIIVGQHMKAFLELLVRVTMAVELIGVEFLLKKKKMLFG